ncbi:MAG TPA: Asp-tRNA(Asn)/Glu-tRNA(Gln) amidotransferase subunit GatB [Candidatus Sumerlaeota bacterium]|nr:Asp-tRNA(Asn)/Glu-tRNA(Gln) amidotransferase subunit GatB [Candidatus Sumerlaeota bacterium]
MEFEPVIGMEAHAELATKTKVFCGCSTAFGAAPNTQVCPVCLGLPGALPVLNKTAFEYVIRTAIALNCTITEKTVFDRKNYYYPDLPKNYQISQNYACIGYNGWIEINVNGEKKQVGMDNVHLEEDAGKNLHPETGGAESLVDLNRAGIALMEIVSRPDMHSADDALAYMETLKNLLQYLEVSDCKMQEGRLRFEVNISMRRKGEQKLGARAEIKNLNSMRTALKCIEYEIKRQTDILSNGGKLNQETRLWDEASFCTRAMRSKEQAQDYRYFPDPDLVEVHIMPEWQEKIRRQIPELKDAKLARFIADYGLPEYDADILTSSKPLATYFEQCQKFHNNPKSISNWIMTELLRELKCREMEPDDCPVTPRHLACMIKMIDEKTISGKIGKQVFSEMLTTGKMPDVIVTESGMSQILDEKEISAIVEKIISENQDTVESIRAGRDKAMAFLVGQIMRATRGKANPQLVNQILKDKISIK